MTTNQHSNADRVRGLLDHLGISKTHLVLYTNELEWPALIAELSDRIAGLGVVVGANISVGPLTPFAPRLVVVVGDKRTPALEAACQQLTGIPIRRLLALAGYSVLTWSDIAKDRTEQLTNGLVECFKTVGGADSGPTLSSGEYNGLTYRIGGSGSPLLLFPFALAASQWEPALQALALQFTTIVLGGPHVGPVAAFEFRAKGSYLGAARALLTELEIGPGQRILEVGCGTGALVRWIAVHHPEASITAVDINPYLLREAAALAAREGFAGRITFREGDACAIPFADATFDRVFSSTVMEEVDADKMMTELVRVTRAGGRVGVLTRSLDRPRWVNAPLPPELRAKTDYTFGSLA